MSVITPDMMSVDFVARCLAGKAKTSAGKNKYGTFEPITIVTPLLTDISATPDEKINPEPLFTKEWKCSPEYVFNGYFKGVFSGRIFINVPDNGLIDDIVDTPSTRIIVGNYYGVPIVISTDSKDCQVFASYANDYMPVCPKTVEYNGFTWYYSAISWGVNEAYTDTGRQVYAYDGTPSYEILGGYAYPTQTMIEDILTLINPTQKEV